MNRSLRVRSDAEQKNRSSVLLVDEHVVAAGGAEPVAPQPVRALGVVEGDVEERAASADQAVP